MDADVPNRIDAFVGGRIRLRRTGLGMRKEVLGDALGVAAAHIRRFENGSERVSARRLQTIANILNVHFSFFFNDEP